MRILFRLRIFSPGVLALLPFLVFLSRPFSPPTSITENPLWWEISLDLKTEGEYKLEDLEAKYSGSYAFRFHWKGTMEKDDADYLLYRLTCERLDWEAYELATSSEFQRTLITQDFAAEPVFNMKYILKKDDILCVDFLVEGFPVPQNESTETFPLLLPSSEENAQHQFETDYNSFVTKGSNRVAFEEKEIYLGPVKKNFSWTWKKHGWLLRQQRTIFTSNRHRVQLKMTIKPHFPDK